MKQPRKKEDILEDIKKLVRSKGYIYALLMIAFEDFHIDVLNMHKTDWHSRLSVKELALLLGFLIQKEVDFSKPENPELVTQLKQKTYSLLGELHLSFIEPHFKSMDEVSGFGPEIDFNTMQEKYFGQGKFMEEPIFYSGDGVYDVQYLDFLGEKYKHDKDWLKKHRSFDIENAKEIVTSIKNILNKKGDKVHLHFLREAISDWIEEGRQKNPNESNKDIESSINEIIPMLEFHQYHELFKFEECAIGNISDEEKRELVWEHFYDGLIELFVITESDLDSNLNFDVFIKSFSAEPGEHCNEDFHGPGDYNLINSHPLIQISDGRFLVPNIFLVFEAIYESPFYWMYSDRSYRSQLTKNRGDVGEDITFTLLKPVFGKSKIFKSVRVRASDFGTTTKKSKDITDIDVLCILGSKALCVQVKSKKLTQLARKGSDEHLQKDFKAGVQDAYNQGLITRQRILDASAKFYDCNENEIVLSEGIDDVYLMCVTTENFPALTHQVRFMLSKNENDPYPVVSTIFDLELVAHYLRDPYDFLYYIRQRSLLAEYFVADGEMTYLGYHLSKKLWKHPKADMMALNNSFAASIGRNYYPMKLGLDVPDTGDDIKTAWKDENFNRLCKRLKTLNQPKKTDIIFCLLDLSGDARKQLVELMIETKTKTSLDGRTHNFSIPPDEKCQLHMGFTYVTDTTNNVRGLQARLLSLCQARKYKSHGDIWIGFGSLNSSCEILDCVVFSSEKWQPDRELESFTNKMFRGKGGAN